MVISRSSADFIAFIPFLIPAARRSSLFFGNKMSYVNKRGALQVFTREREKRKVFSLVFFGLRIEAFLIKTIAAAVEVPHRTPPPSLLLCWLFGHNNLDRQSFLLCGAAESFFFEIDKRGENFFFSSFTEKVSLITKKRLHAKDLLPSHGYNIDWLEKSRRAKSINFAVDKDRMIIHLGTRWLRQKVKQSSSSRRFIVNQLFESQWEKGKRQPRLSNFVGALILELLLVLPPCTWLTDWLLFVALEAPEWNTLLCYAKLCRLFNISAIASKQASKHR